MSAIDQERGNWTSASNAEADALCPGRFHAQRGLPEIQSDDALSGQRVHAALCEDTEAKLSDDEWETYEKCRSIEADIVPVIFGDVPGDEIKSIREQRLWLDTGAFKHSGKPDVIHYRFGVAVILDYKTGRNDVAESPRNLQLRDLAVLAAANHGFSQVHVAIIQPWVMMKPEICVYGIDELLAAQDEMLARIEASHNLNAKRVPGEAQCKYCRARSRCDDFLAAALPVSLPAPDVEAGVAALDGKRLGHFLSIIRMAEETATTEVRRRLDAGETVDGWTVKPGRETEKITDATLVFQRSLGAGISQTAFVSECITVGKTALKSALKTASGLKGKALDAKLGEIIDGATETKTSAPILTHT